MASQDPRSSSTQSLVPPSEDRAGRRRLLLIYVHGFMGDETSFRNFPAHVHNLVSITLAESHVVHTKIYPKYRSRYAIEVARDDFSKWLYPHEDRWTDVILLAHSMGGLVAADVALTCRHRIIGTIHFDVPFLGMHPGIIKAGLGSIFKPWPTPEEHIGEEPVPVGKKPNRFNTLFNPKPNDPNFNPSFYNDVHLPVRKGWENTLHWLNKHSNGIVQASKSLVQSHLEFGGAMADYRTLKARYAKIRALEEDDPRKRMYAVDEVANAPRIRFVNYYTTSTGRPKKPKSPKSPSHSRPTSRSSQRPEDSTAALASTSQLTLDTKNSRPSTTSPRVSIDHHVDDDVLQVIPPTPLDEAKKEPSIEDEPTKAESGPELPDIPPIPKEPPFVDLAQYTDKAQRKTAEKEHEQALKEYQQAVKARNKVINERTKIEEKWEKQKKKDEQTKARARGKDKVESAHNSDIPNEDLGAVQLGAGETPRRTSGNGPYGNYDFSRSTIMNQVEPDEQASYTTASNPPSTYNESAYSLATTDTNTASGPETPKKKKRLKKFCMLPPEDANGNKDPAWIRVFMEGIDEVQAHTTLFFVNDTYEQLVGDVRARIEEWVSEADSLRLVRELEGL
ncbi:hypothetical protein N0V90_000331 [Kalmusia sp. IMI 367209]|nr:hypothetical protein N0V90_000331 [Kalmusia sp. IMI 367209]